VKVINSPLMWSPWPSTTYKEKLNEQMLSKRMDPSLHVYELRNEIPQTRGKEV